MNNRLYSVILNRIATSKIFDAGFFLWDFKNHFQNQWQLLRAGTKAGSPDSWRYRSDLARQAAGTIAPRRSKTHPMAPPDGVAGDMHRRGSIRLFVFVVHEGLQQMHGFQPGVPPPLQGGLA